MKKIIALVLTLALAVSALCGCSALEEVIPDQTITKDALTITFPGYYLNLSDEDYAEGMEFLYGFNNTAVMAIKEDRATLEAILPELTAQDYADLFIESNNLTSTAEEKDGVITFRYTAVASGTEFTYICAVFMAETDIWTVQAYTPTDELEKNETDMWKILTSVKVA